MMQQFAGSPVRRAEEQPKINGKTFDAVLREAFEAGRQHALSEAVGGLNDVPAPDFEEWKRGQLP